MDEPTINEALLAALKSPIEEVVTHAEVISEQLKTIDELGGFNQGGKDLYDEIRAVSPSSVCVCVCAFCDVSLGS